MITLRPERRLAVLTDLLQRARLREPDAGVWEAADLQWWSVMAPQAEAVLWSDESVAVNLTHWPGGAVGVDLLGHDTVDAAWAYLAAVAPQGAEMVVPDRPADLARASAAGFEGTGATYLTSWLKAAERERPRPLPPGYRIVTRADRQGDHPMARRHGSEVGARLEACSLYRPGLDLAVIAPDHAVAGYGLFWADGRTGIGLVEPMRVEAGHGGRGLGAALLGAGLDGLTRAGCRRLKVHHAPDNSTAGRLYAGAGFRVVSRAVTRIRVGRLDLSRSLASASEAPPA